MQLDRIDGGGGGAGDVDVVVVVSRAVAATENLIGDWQQSAVVAGGPDRKIIQIEFSIAPNSNGTARSWST